jgi:replication factor A1
MSKREITVVDISSTSVRLTLWTSSAENFAGIVGQCIAIKATKIGDYGGRSLSTVNDSVIEINPDLPDAHNLIGWWAQLGGNAQFATISGQSSSSNDVRKSLLFAKDEHLGGGDKVLHILEARLILTHSSPSLIIIV